MAKSPKKAIKKNETKVTAVERAASTPGFDLEAELLTGVSTVEFDDPEFPMIMVAGYNRNIILDYKVEILRPIQSEPDLDAREVLSDDEKQSYLEAAYDKKLLFKRNLWDKLLPMLIGFQQAQVEVGEEMRDLFGDDIVSLAPYHRALRDTAFAACVLEVATTFNVPADYATLILRSKLDEQANRTRPDARTDGQLPIV